MATTAAPSTAVAERKPVDMGKPVADALTLRRVIAERFKSIAALLPGHMTEERFCGIVVAEAAKNSTIFNCTAASIINCIFQAAALGLEINSATGDAYLVPFKDTCTLVPGYRGLVKLAIRSREVVAIEARLVYADERNFRVFYGTDSRVEHEPDFTVQRTPDKVVCAYAVAKLPNGSATFDVMTFQQLEGIRRRSKAQGASSPWATDTEEMYRKTVTRRLVKYLPMSPELAEAVELADTAEGIVRTDARHELSAGASDLNKAIAESSSASTITKESTEDILAQDRATVAADRQREQGGR